MKKIVALFLLTVGVFTPCVGGSVITYQDSEPLPQKKGDDTVDRPKLPSVQDGITCEYDGQYLIISFEKGEGMAFMVLSYASDGSVIESINFPVSSEFIYYIGELDEPVNVDITGAGGHFSDTFF